MSTWAMFQGAHYHFGPYLSPFYSPELLGRVRRTRGLASCRPGWPSFIPFSAALVILPFPA